MQELLPLCLTWIQTCNVIYKMHIQNSNLDEIITPHPLFLLLLLWKFCQKSSFLILVVLKSSLHSLYALVMIYWFCFGWTKKQIAMKVLGWPKAQIFWGQICLKNNLKHTQQARRPWNISWLTYLLFTGPLAET